MQAIVYHLTEEKDHSVSLPEGIFGTKENPILLAEAVRVFLANQRKAKAKAKRRGEVSGSGIKIWRQKGTGRARHGDRYAPIFVGGGVAHGPTGKENWRLSLPRKKKLAALATALSFKLKNKEMVFVDELSRSGEKTKTAGNFLVKILERSGLGKGLVSRPKVTLVFAEGKKQEILPFRNLSWVTTVRVNDLNPYLVLDNKYLILEEKVLEKLALIKREKSSQAKIRATKSPSLKQIKKND